MAKSKLAELVTRSVVSRDVKLVRRLVDLGASVDAQWNTYTPLTTACELVDLKMVKFLLSEGAASQTLCEARRQCRSGGRRRGIRVGLREKNKASRGY